MKGLLVLALAAVVSASGKGYGESGYEHGANRRRYEVAYSKTYTYHGKYGGKCDNDGLYYRNDASFVFCSNGNNYVQPCAPGTRNGAYDSYNHGGDYGYNDFCSINLVDYGYGAKSKKTYGGTKGYEVGRKVSYGYEEKKPSFGYAEKKTSYGYEEKKPSYGYAEKKPSYGYAEKKPSHGYAEKKTSYGYAEKKPSYGYAEKRPSYGYAEKKPSYGYAEKKTSYGYAEKKPSYGYAEKKPSYGYSESYGTKGYGEKEYSRNSYSTYDKKHDRHDGYGSDRGHHSDGYGKDRGYGYKKEVRSYGHKDDGYRRDEHRGNGYSGDHYRGESLGHRDEGYGYGGSKGGYHGNSYDNDRHPRVEHREYRGKSYGVGHRSRH